MEMSREIGGNQGGGTAFNQLGGPMLHVFVRDCDLDGGAKLSVRQHLHVILQ